MEMCDIVDENDNVIGTASREECHKDPALIHHVVHFVVYNTQSKKFLLLKRSINSETDPGKYSFLGEHMTSGETYLDGLKRGLIEEIGVAKFDLKEAGKHLFKFKNQSELATFYIVFINNDTIKISKREHVDIKWVTKKELLGIVETLPSATQYWIKLIESEQIKSPELRMSLL